MDILLIILGAICMITGLKFLHALGHHPRQEFKNYLEFTHFRLHAYTFFRTCLFIGITRVV